MWCGVRRNLKTAQRSTLKDLQVRLVSLAKRYVLSARWAYGGVSRALLRPEIASESIFLTSVLLVAILTHIHIASKSHLVLAQAVLILAMQKLYCCRMCIL